MPSLPVFLHGVVDFLRCELGRSVLVGVEDLGEKCVGGNKTYLTTFSRESTSALSGHISNENRVSTKERKSARLTWTRIDGQIERQKEIQTDGVEKFLTTFSQVKFVK